jgi:hypothetical protein
LKLAAGSHNIAGAASPLPPSTVPPAAAAVPAGVAGPAVATDGATVDDVDVFEAQRILLTMCADIIDERLLTRHDLMKLRRCLTQLQGAAVQLSNPTGQQQQQQQQQIHPAAASIARLNVSIKVRFLSQHSSLNVIIHDTASAQKLVTLELMHTCFIVQTKPGAQDGPFTTQIRPGTEYMDIIRKL